MAEPNQAHEAMLRRHRSALVRFASASKLPPEKMAFVVADPNLNLGRATKQSGIIATDRASIVIPVSVDDLPRFAEVVGASEVEQLRVEHGAVPILVIDADDQPAVVWERLLPPQRSDAQNRSIILSGVRDCG